MSVPKKKCDHDNMMRPPTNMGYADTNIKLSLNRSIFLCEEITKQVGAQLAALLIYYDHVDHEVPIYLHINSSGGDAAGLSAIIDTFSIISAPVHTLLLGKCYSAGAIILAAGKKDCRFSMPSAKIMVHGIQFGFPIPGNDLQDNKKYFDFVNTNNDLIMRLLAKYTGQPMEALREICRREVWLTPQEGIKLGLIDHVV